jgi:hypothetical protein
MEVILMTPHCPDEKCKKKVEDMEDEMNAIKVRANFLKAVLWILIPVIISVSGVALLVWADSRSIPTIYATVKSVGETNDIIHKRIQSIEMEQIGLKINNEYTRQSVDEILRILKDKNRKFIIK